MHPTDRTSRRLFLASAAVLLFAYGFAVGCFRLFPYQFLALAGQGLAELREQAELPWYYRRVSVARSMPGVAGPATQDAGLVLVTRVAEDRRLVAEVLGRDGRSLHRWDLDWFRLGDPSYLPPESRPRARPGCQVHGAVVMDNGDLVFNFDHLGLVRVDLRGDVVWRLNYRTHHSVHLHDDGTLWVCGQRERNQFDPRFAHRRVPRDEYTVVQVSPAGQVLNEWSIPELLLENERLGLLHLGSDQPHVQVRDDLLHLNDVEPFPDSMPEGFFRRGDVLVSLRNINTVLVFNRHTRRIRYCYSGAFVGQHDPDFVDGDHYSVFDNRTISQRDEGLSSRILVISAPENKIRVAYEGTSEAPFFTRLMGKHQWQADGNLLIVSSQQGTAFEVTATGRRVWQYWNFVAPGVTGNVQEVQRLPDQLRSVFERSPGTGPSVDQVVEGDQIVES